MPVILKPEAYKDWMDEENPNEALKALLRSQVQREFAFRPVSKAVKKIENNSADLIEAA